MRVAIAGAHGQVAIRLSRLLVERGDDVIGLIRNPGHAEDLRAAGVDPEICDLEHATLDQVAAAVGGSDAVVFAAGAGPGSGAARKITMDRDGAIKLLNATAVDSSHYVMLSGIGVENPPDGDDVYSVYLRAKAEADGAVTASDRDWTIVRPGRANRRSQYRPSPRRLFAVPRRDPSRRPRDVSRRRASRPARRTSHSLRQWRPGADRPGARSCIHADIVTCDEYERRTRVRDRSGRDVRRR